MLKLLPRLLPGLGDGFLVGDGFFCSQNGFPLHSSGLLTGSSVKNTLMVFKGLQNVFAYIFWQFYQVP